VSLDVHSFHRKGKPLTHRGHFNWIGSGRKLALKRLHTMC